MDITLTLECNNNCSFCPRQSYLRHISCRSLGEVYRDIEAIGRTSEKIVLSGGEVTLLKVLWDILGFCKMKKFQRIGIITNGRRLKDLRFARRLVCSGVSDIAISLYSLDARIHDGITRSPGSCQETKEGIANILKLSSRHNISFRINLVLNYWNSSDIIETVKTLASLGISNFIIAEQIIMDKKSPHLSIQRTQKCLKKIVMSDWNGAQICLRGFPPCFLSEFSSDPHAPLVVGKRCSGVFLERLDVNTFVKADRKKKAYLKKFTSLFFKPHSCHRCGYATHCIGMQKFYFE